MSQCDAVQFLVVDKIIHLIIEFLKCLAINIVHKYLVPASTDMLEPFWAELLNHLYDLGKLLLGDLFESLVESVLFA